MRVVFHFHRVARNDAHCKLYFSFPKYRSTSTFQPFHIFHTIISRCAAVKLLFGIFSTKKNQINQILKKQIVILYSMGMLFCARIYIQNLLYVSFHTHTPKTKHSYTCARTVRCVTPLVCVCPCILSSILKFIRTLVRK